MNYTEVMDALDRASLFELFRLNAAISNQLDDPRRIHAVKQALRVGQTVRWFDHVENRLQEAKLLRINRTRAEIENLGDGKRWSIPFHQIDLEGEDVTIATQKRQAVDRNRLSVGDRVAFKDRDGHERFGQVVKLNTKTASVQVGTVRWRVGYGLLTPVIDGALGELLDDPLALPGVWSRVEP
ncbi:hypothetical protein [Thiocapsa sp. UBA6158]|jgi:hypothetical protein|uniref:hypothetical protein n=1 Tax=Thiocapsa sp. UBA6158 TaxID=1947692 RepID=UPI0025CC0BC1|nr:hypothetical protein [Thiocapsa sp. UBA6158]